jgi:uncharacterized Zn-binding protein involved in type VI secretion
MTRRVIRLGDPTSHDGKVIASGAPHYTVDGIAVALQGDACSCPKKNHTDCVIAEGDPGHTIHGVPVAYEGHKTSCGATLIATIRTYTKA